MIETIESLEARLKQADLSELQSILNNPCENDLQGDEMGRVSAKTIRIRGGYIHIQNQRDGVRMRFSTKLKDTPENRQFVLDNYDRIIKAHCATMIQKGAELSGDIAPTILTGILSKTGQIKRAVQEIQTNPKHKLSDYFERLKTTSAYNMKPSTYDKFSKKVDLLASCFKDKFVEDITRSDIEKFYIQLQIKGLSNSYAKSHSRLLYRVFEIAYYDEIITKNPIFPYPYKAKQPKAQPKPLSLNEIKEVLSETKKPIYPKYFHNMLKIAFFSGIRSGELYALKAESLDFKHNKLRINATIILRGQEGSPKTPRSNRVIDMLPPVREALLDELQITESQLAEANGDIQKAMERFYTPAQKRLKRRCPYIFYRKTSYKPFYGATPFRDSWLKALKACGLEDRVFYNTRHSFASVMLSAGEEQMWVSKMLGHENLSITLKHYARFIEDANKQRAAFLKDFDL